MPIQYAGRHRMGTCTPILPLMQVMHPRPLKVQTPPLSSALPNPPSSPPMEDYR